MKKLILICLIISVKFCTAQEYYEQKIKTDIHAVTVFITGGEIERQADLNLKRGRNKLVFTDISTVADGKSIQFTADKAFNLVSIHTEIDYLSSAHNNPQIQKLRDSLEIINLKITDLKNERNGYKDEKDLLLLNNSIKAEDQNLSVQELKEMAEFYRKRLLAISNTITDYDTEINSWVTQRSRYQNQLTELNYRETVKSNQIIVMVDVSENTQLSARLRYVVSNCGWQANYDLSANDATGKIRLKYKAKVFNNTGNDWLNVGLTLSTADPNLSASAPVLSPWYLSYESLGTNDYDKRDQTYVVPSNREYQQYYSNANVPVMSQNLDGVSFGWMNGDTGNENQWIPSGTGGTVSSSVSFTTIEVSQLVTEFPIERKYTIPSDSRPYLVEIKEHDLEATFSHKAVPKLDRDAFLLANIVGWEQLDLVPGPTNVYFASTYVGQSYINTRNVGDTLRLSFGRDKKVIINRKLLEEYSDKKVIGNNRKDTYTYEISLKNTHGNAVKIDLFDQVPISQDSDISITADEISSAEHDLTTGILKWIVPLDPGETKTFRLSFTIKYPKEKKIQVQNFRTISCPSF